ncbi:hypothetical protein CFAM422_001262 [Trichoderma lentiforme]|uniref:Uncharacterized protein n=1 Tax=Trichoderma lentiforme TaxID=1567552 RepID=A0A9P4XQ47_9HYPO|nr:hypothetical protein CFAM422_001262 [Trichoderma lentiforme]
MCPIPGKLPRKLEMSDILVDIDDVYYTGAVKAIKAYWAQAKRKAEKKATFADEVNKLTAPPPPPGPVPLGAAATGNTLLVNVLGQCLNKLKRYLIEQYNVTAMCFEYVTLVLREIMTLRNNRVARAEDIDRLVKKVD